MGGSHCISMTIECPRAASRPRRVKLSIGSDGIGACTIVSHTRHDSFGRTCRITLNEAGTYSRTSVSSSANLRNCPPQLRHEQDGS